MSEAKAPDSPLAQSFVASPNHGERRGFSRPDCVILHYTGMTSGEAALKWLCDPASQVSSHYLVWEDGRIVQMVGEERRAWHAGRAFWKGVSDLNSASIGVEIVNPGHDGGLPPFPDSQIEAVVALLRDIGARNAIAPERVLAHSDIAPGRKRDPGENFPWERLGRAGVAQWIAPAPIVAGPTLRAGQKGPPARALQAMLALYGYDVEISGVYDQRTERAVAAFQRRFRPARVDGEADPSTLATLRDLVPASAQV